LAKGGWEGFSKTISNSEIVTKTVGQVYHIGREFSRMGRERVDNTSHVETLSHSTTYDLSIDEVKSSPQGFVLCQRLLIPEICDL
jgi:hypothetical protein